MTVDWRHTREEKRGILSVAPSLGPDAARRFTGSIGWVVARGTGPVIVDLTQLPAGSAEDRAGAHVIPGARVRSTTVARRGLPNGAAPEGHVKYAVAAASWAGAALAEGSRAARQAATAGFGGSWGRPTWPVSHARMGLMFQTSGWMRRAEARPAGPCVEKETAR
ncbi:anti-sigma factor antagonist [Streptomyces griseorubiginosus]|uniref:anti-sigma factor antagonist n=1 Tax=Streptomyces griseorubiginosus TaxID=67304 RepID=UPI00363F3D82